jgi:hypothetical protein
MENLGQPVATAPSKRALQLWLAGQKDPDGFRKQFLAMLLTDRAHDAQNVAGVTFLLKESPKIDRYFRTP